MKTTYLVKSGPDRWDLAKAIVTPGERIIWIGIEHPDIPHGDHCELKSVEIVTEGLMKLLVKFRNVGEFTVFYQFSGGNNYATKAD